MQKDIKINTNTNDIVLIDQNVSTMYACERSSKKNEDDTHVFFEINCPKQICDKTKLIDNICFVLPYYPIYKNARICISQKIDAVDYYLSTTSDDGNWWIKDNNDGLIGEKKIWFNVKKKHDEKIEDVKVSQFAFINADWKYKMFFSVSNADAYIYSSVKSELKVIETSYQNANLLLACAPSNYYRYPTSGVGLGLYVNGNLMGEELASIIKREFELDGMTINTASFNNVDGSFSLSLNTVDVKIKIDGNV